MATDTPHVYIAGPMRGYPYFNFDAFYAAELAVAKHFGWDAQEWAPERRTTTPGVRGIDGSSKVVIFNPARYDHETIGPKVNDSPTGDLADIEGVFDLRHALGRDLAWIAEKATHIYLLDGWEDSKGARAEAALAEALGLTVLFQTDSKPAQASNIQTNEEYVYTYNYDKAGFDKYPVPPELRSGPTRLPVYTGNVTLGADGPTLSNVQTGEVRVTSLTGGEKGSKPARYDLIPVVPLHTLACLYGKGAEKYADRNWERGYDWSLSFSALNRHLWAFWNGEDNDPEHGLPHLASVAWHAFAMMEWAQTHPEFDNRPKA